MNREQMLSLKVGDVVCDCRFKHLKIVEIHEEWWSSVPKWLLWTPLFLHGLIEHFVPETLHDKRLVFEDGQSCSALNCVHAVPHDWEHPDGS